MGTQIINGDVEITGQLLKGDLKALYNLSTYDSVDTSNADYDVITRNGWKRNVSKWILEHADELNFRDTTNGHEIGKDGGNGAFPSALVGSGSLMTGVCNQLFEFGSDDAAWANTSGYVFNPNWISLPSSYSTKASYLEFFSTHEIIVDYKLNFSYQETVIKNRPISQLDQDGESWVKSEYEKGLNLLNIDAIGSGLLVSHTSTQFKTHLTSTDNFYKYSFKANTAYTFSCDYITEVASSNLRLYFKYTDGTTDIVLDNIYSAVSNTRYSSSVTSDSSKTLASIGITYGSSYGGGSLTIFNPMLVEGPVRKPFVEYSGGITHQKDLSDALSFRRQYRLWAGQDITTDIPSDGGEGGRTLLVLYSDHYSSGDSTCSGIGYIRLGYDGHNVHYTHVAGTNPNDRSVWFNADGDKLRIQSGSGYMATAKVIFIG